MRRNCGTRAYNVDYLYILVLLSRWRTIACDATKQNKRESKSRTIKRTDKRSVNKEDNKDIGNNITKKRQDTIGSIRICVIVLL